jgi:hypothetical protein
MFQTKITLIVPDSVGNQTIYPLDEVSCTIELLPRERDEVN